MLINTIGTLLGLASGCFAISKTTTFEYRNDNKIGIKIKWFKFLVIVLSSLVLITILQYLLGTVLPIDIA